MKTLVCLALATLVISPVFAQDRNSNRVSAVRAAAIHECSVAASRYTEYTWGNMEFNQYRACMAQHGQPE